LKKPTGRIPTTDEAGLVRRAQGGDREAFAELFTRLHQPVLNYIYHTLGDLQAAEDVTQDAFIRAHQHLERLGPPWDFKSWVYRIASNLAIDDLRGRKRLVEMPDEGEETESMPEAPTTRRPIERKVQQDELRRSVWGTLDRMPTSYRQALILREISGLSYDEVARSLECTYANARQMVHRARMQFREMHGLRVVLAGGASRCQTLGDMLSAYHDGELGKQERRAVETHIAACPDCRETRDDLKRVGALLAGLTPILPSPQWTARLLDRLDSGPPSGGAAGSGGAGGGGGDGGLPAAPGLGSAVPWIALAVGAPIVAAGLLVGGWLFFRDGPPPTPTPAVAGPLPPAASPTRAAATRTPTPPPASATSTASPTATLTPTLEPPSAFAPVDVNCRDYSGADGRIIGTFRAEATAPIEGRNEDSSWWWIPNPDWLGHCWVWSGAVEERGDLSAVPLIRLPSPTPPGCWVRPVTQGALVCVVPCPPNAYPGGACSP